MHGTLVRRTLLLLQDVAQSGLRAARGVEHAVGVLVLPSLGQALGHILADTTLEHRLSAVEVPFSRRLGRGEQSLLEHRPIRRMPQHALRGSKPHPWRDGGAHGDCRFLVGSVGGGLKSNAFWQEALVPLGTLHPGLYRPDVEMRTALREPVCTGQ